MAGTKALNVRMNFQVDTTQARQQIQQLGVQLNSITKSTMSGANSSLGITSQILEATKAAGQLKNALAEAMNPLTGNLNLSAFSDQLIASKMQLSDYRTQLANLGTAGNQAFNSLSRAIMTAETPMLRTGKAAQQMWTVLGNTVRWQMTSSMIHGIMSTASQAMNYVKSLDSSLNSIRIVTGQNQAQMERFAKTANQAAKTLNTTTNAYAKASLIYYQQGLSNEEVEKRTATTVKLANVSRQTAQKVSDQLTAIWNNFYDGSKSLEYYADVMTALGASTASSTDEIAKGLEKFSSIAKTTGLSYEYATSALSTVVAATRQSADSVGTSFKTLFSRLQGLSLGETLDDGTTLNKYSKALNTIGVNIKNANGSLKDMDNILNEIGDRWTSLSKAEQVALAQTVGGARNYTGLVSLMDNWDSFQKNLQTAQQAQGTLQAQADIYAQSWEAASTHVRSASETIYKNLFDDKFFVGLTNAYGSLLDMTGTLTTQMGGFKGVMSTVANFALNTFAPQITKSFANIGSSIYGMTPGGQERVLNLRKEAMNAVTSNIRLSQYDNVDKMAHSFNQAFVDRQVAFDNAVQQGRISEYQQPIYQSLIGQLGQESDKLVAQAEQNAFMANARRLDNSSLLADIQSGISARYKQFQGEFRGVQPGSERYIKIMRNPATAARYQAYMSFPTSQFNAKSLQPYIDDYTLKKSQEESAKDFMTYYKNSSFSLATKDMRQVADGLYGLALAAKTSNKSLDEVIPGLGQFDATLTGMKKSVDQLSDAELQSLFSGTKIDQALSKMAFNLESGNLESTEVRRQMNEQIRTQLGILPNQHSDILDKANAILDNNALTGSEKAAELSRMGIILSQSKNYTDQMNNEAIPATIAMSSALVTNMNALAAAGQIFNSVTTAVKTFGDENATAGQHVASLTSLAMSIGMAGKPMSNFFKTAKNNVEIFGKSIGMTNGVLGGLMLTAAALVVAGKQINKEWQDNFNLDKIVSGYSDSIAVATQKASEAQAAYENLITQKDTHNKLLDELSLLQKGTLEFNNTLLQASANASQLIEDYDLIYGEDYVYGEYGTPEFDQDRLDQKIRDKQQEAIDTEYDKLILTQTRNLIDNYNQVSEDYSGTLGDLVSRNLTQSDKYLGDLFTGLGADTLTGLINEYEIQGNGRSFAEWYEDWFSKSIENNPNISKEDRESALQQSKQIIGDIIPELKTFADVSELITNIDQINKNDQLTDVERTKEIATAIAGADSEYVLKQRSYASAIVAAELGKRQDLTEAEKDLYALGATDNYSDTNLIQAAMFAHQLGTSGFFENIFGTNAKTAYEVFLGEKANNLTDEEIREAIETKMTSLLFTDANQLEEKLSVFGKTFSDLGLINFNEDLTTTIKNLQDINLPDIGNLNYEGIFEAFNQLIPSEEFNENYFSNRSQIIKNYRDYGAQLYESLQKNIQEGLLINFRDSKLDATLNQNEFTNYAASIIGELNYNNLKLIEQAIGNANGIGKDSVDQLVKTLQEDTDQRGYEATSLTDSTKEFLEKYNFDNSLSGIYSNTQLARYIKNTETRNKIENQLIADIKAAGEEKGLFEMLYHSSGFEKVMENLKDIFNETGNLTAANIEKIASKQDELNQLLNIGAETVAGVNINSAGLASVFTDILKGNLDINDVSSTLLRSSSIARQGASLDQRALTYASNLDLGASSADFLDYFQEMGKAYYQAEKAGWGFNNEQMRNMVALLGNTEIKDAYYKANRSGEIKFPELMKQMPSYFTDYLDTMAGKKGKGGGGPADTFSFLYSAINGADISEDEWNRLGFKIDSKGNVTLGNGMTQEMFIDSFKGLLMRNGYTEEAATELATNSAALVHQSGNTGALMDDAAVKLGIAQLTGKQLKSGEELEDLRAKNEGQILYDNEEFYTTPNEKTITTDTDLKSYIRQNETWFKNNGFADFFGQYGEINMDQVENWFNNEVAKGNSNVMYLRDLSSYFSGPNKGKASIQGMMQESTGNQALTDAEAREAFRQQALDYGAYIEGENENEPGTWDYDKLLELVEAQGGTAGDLATLVQNSLDLFSGNLIGHDINGNPVVFGSEGNKTWAQFQGALQTGGNVSQYITPYLGSETSAGIYSAYKGMYYKNASGDYEMDLDGSKREAADELRGLLEEFKASGYDTESENSVKNKIEAFIAKNLTNGNLDTGILDEYGYESDQLKEPETETGPSNDDIIKMADALGVTPNEAKKFLESGFEGSYQEWEEQQKEPETPEEEIPEPEITNEETIEPESASESEPETTSGPVSEYYEPDDTPSAEWTISPATENQEENPLSYDVDADGNIITAEPGSNEFNEASFTSQMSPQEYAQYTAWKNAGGSGSQAEWDALKQRAEEAAAEQAAKEEADKLAEEQANELQAQEEAVQAEEEATMVADAIGEATESAATTTAETQNTLAENINENLSAMGEAIPGTEEYDKAFASASQYTPTDTAAEKTNDLLTDSLRQEKFIAENTQITAESTAGLLEGSEEDAEATAKAKATGKAKEDEMVDEEGNPLEMPEGQQPSGGGGGGGNSNGEGGPGIGPGGKNNTGQFPWSNATTVGDLTSGGYMGLFNAAVEQGGVVGAIQAGFSPELVQSYVDAVNAVGAASGQNNARLLAYASGKEGHIAVTGELGPELRVKSDGSMDILGKTGREYAWVEPDDRIYTASQSAGILKSNKIPGLEGLAKGINNYIPGYVTGATTDWGSSGSSGGGGGGGGRSRGGGGGSSEEDPRYDPKTLKIRDVLERYYTILQQIDNITKAVERFSKVADRAWGRERIRAIEKQNEMQEKQYEAQKKYIAEIEDYLTTDQAALTTMIQEFVTGWNDAAKDKEDMEKLSWTGAEYDENGVLTNYREFVEKLVEQYNQKAASANQKDQYKFQEQLKDIQMYTDTLNLYEEQKDALEDIKNAILDTAIKAISYEVEYKLELSGDADRILNFQADKYKDDVYQAAKYLEFLDQRADLTRQNLISVQDGIFKTLGTYAGEAMRTGAKHSLEELGIYGTDQFKLDEELTDVDEDETEEARIDRLKGISTKVNEWLDQLREKNADAAAEIDKMIEHSEEEGQEDIITNYEEVIRRLNQQIDYTMVRAKVDEWLEELRSKNAEAAAEIDKIVQRNADGEIINYTDVIERLNEENVRLSDEAITLLMEDQDAFFNWMSDFKDNPGWVDFTTEHKDLLTNYMDQIYQYLESLQDTYEQTIEQLGDSIKATSKQMDTAIDEFDYYGDVYKTFGNIVDLTNRHMTDVSKDFFDSLNNRVMDNSINKIKATATNYHLLQKELEEVTRQYNEMQARADAATGEEQIYLQQSADKLKEQLDIANSQYEDAHKAFLSSWEDALSKMAENYKAAVEEASRNFEQGFSPLFNTLALLQAQFDREKALGDLYVDNYQRIHDLSKLNRDIESSILDTDNLKGKERLRDLQKEINDLQADGTELSEYDLDILDKKYKLELARQALEDAKDAKSLVRLARDNNGNWSYVYTANEDDVEKAEQDYEDAIREMEQANEDYIENIQDQIVQVQQEAQQAILALQPEDFATYDDYLAAVQAIQNSMYDTLNFLRSQMNNAFANNEYLDPYIINRYGLNDHDLTTDFEDTTLAKLLDSNNLDQSINHAKDNFENNLLRPALDAYLIYSQKQQEVYEAAEHDMATIGADFGQEMRYVAEMSDNEVQIVEKLSNRVQTAFEDMAAVVDEKTQKHLAEIDELVNKYEKLVEALTEVKRLSGENLPSDMMQAIDTVDTWREIEDLENKLKENGHIRLLEDLVDINREDVIYRSDKLTDATEQIDKWLESLGDSAKEIAETVERNDAGQITNYKDIVQKLSNIEKNDDNKATLKEIKKWKEKDDKAVLMDENQALTEEGLWTYLMAGDEYTKKFLKDKIDNAAKNGAIDVGADVDETEKEKVENYLKAHGIVYVKWDNGLEKFESMDDWLAWYEKHKYVPPSDDGGDYHPPDRGWEYGGSHGGTYWFPTDTGGYTGRWQTESVSMYTGEWPGGSVRRNGRIGLLHQKELVLNAHDTENFLDAMQIVRQLDNLTNWMANGLGDLITPTISDNYGELEQNVHIEAEFPNVQDHNEIEQAFNNLVNMASQYANRK